MHQTSSESSSAIADALGIAAHVVPSCSPRLVETLHEEGFDRHLLHYASDDGDTIPAFLAVRHGLGPFPGVAVFHQSNEERNLGKSEVSGLGGDRWQGVGPPLARAGYVVLAPDSIAFEDRRRHDSGSRVHPRDWDEHYNELAYRLIHGDTLARKVIDEARLAISALLALDNVDARCVGAFGHCYGGRTALFLFAVDERVRYVASRGAACTYRRKVADRNAIPMAEVVPGFAARFEIDGVVAAFAPRPLLVMSADADRYSADAPNIETRTARAWEATGCSPADPSSVRRRARARRHTLRRGHRVDRGPGDAGSPARPHPARGRPPVRAAGHVTHRSAPWPRTDGVVTLRPPQDGDAQVLIAGRDAEWERWIGPGDPQGPRPTACIVVDDQIVGWVDYDTDAASVGPGEANVGYNVFAPQRRRGYATRSLRLLFDVLREETDVELAQLMIGEGNVASIGVAQALGAQLSRRVVEAGEVMLRYVVPLQDG